MDGKYPHLFDSHVHDSSTIFNNHAFDVTMLHNVGNTPSGWVTLLVHRYPPLGVALTCRACHWSSFIASMSFWGRNTGGVNQKPFGGLWLIYGWFMDDLWMVGGFKSVYMLALLSAIARPGSVRTKPVLRDVPMALGSPTSNWLRLSRRSAVSGASTVRLADLRASMTSSTLEKDVVRVLRARRRAGGDGEILLQQKVANFFELDILIGGWGWGW